MDKVLYGGKIYIDRGDFQEALYIKDGYIEDLGSSEEIMNKYPQAPRIDCQGKTLIPGLNDSHMHFMLVGEARNQVDIEGATSIEDLIDRCKKFIEENPQRVEKGLHSIGWNQDLFADKGRLPDRHDLDKISTQIPIVLERVCGHIVSSNTKVIELLKEKHPSLNFPDGEVLLGEDGYPNGIYTANACNFAKDIIPDFTMEEREKIIIETMDYAVSKGLTSVQSNDVGTTFMDGPGAFALFKKIYREGKGLLRYRHQVCFNNMEDFREYLEEGEFAKGDYPQDSWLQLGPLKLFKDGSLGARTALVREAYKDDPGNFGREWIKKEEMEAYCQLAADHNMQVVTHVIGDRAIEETIEAYKKAFVGGKNSLRHSLVHCQITDRALLEKIAREDIGVMAQPIFLDYDMKVVENRVGEALSSTSYAFKTLKDLGAHVAYGTDAPVESLNPFPNIYMAVTRKDKEGNPPQGFYSQEGVDVYEAIDAYTVESAYLEFMEDKKGRLKKGYYADMVLLDRDIFTIDPMEIKDIRPLMTLVGGEVVYRDQDRF